VKTNFKQRLGFIRALFCIYTPIKTKILFSVFRNLMKSYPDGHKDKEYWREKGWLQGKKPW
jgi:hypothetical protein